MAVRFILFYIPLYIPLRYRHTLKSGMTNTKHFDLTSVGELASLRLTEQKIAALAAATCNVDWKSQSEQSA